MIIIQFPSNEDYSLSKIADLVRVRLTKNNIKFEESELLEKTMVAPYETSIFFDDGNDEEDIKLD